MLTLPLICSCFGFPPNRQQSLTDEVNHHHTAASNKVLSMPPIRTPQAISDRGVKLVQPDVLLPLPLPPAAACSTEAVASTAAAPPWSTPGPAQRRATCPCRPQGSRPSVSCDGRMQRGPVLRDSVTPQALTTYRTATGGMNGGAELRRENTSGTGGAAGSPCDTKSGCLRHSDGVMRCQVRATCLHGACVHQGGASERGIRARQAGGHMCVSEQNSYWPIALPLSALMGNTS